jgi:hypothetical protein
MYKIGENSHAFGSSRKQKYFCCERFNGTVKQNSKGTNGIYPNPNPLMGFTGSEK